MARPVVYKDDSVVVVTTENAKTKLQTGSERRAIVNVIIDKGGSMTLLELDEHFGYDIRPRVAALARSGWLEVKDA